MSDLTPRAALREALDFIDQHSTPVPNVLVRARWEAALDAHQCLPSEEELAHHAALLEAAVRRERAEEALAGVLHRNPHLHPVSEE